MTLYHFVWGTLAVAAIALVPAGSAVANRRPLHVMPSHVRVDKRDASQLIVSEAFDIAGSETRIVSFPIVNGILQPNQNGKFGTAVPAIAMAKNGLLYDSATVLGVTIDTIDLATHSIVRQFEFGRDNNENKSVTAMTLDRQGRLYLAFTNNGLCCGNVIAIFPPHASGPVHPLGLIRLSGQEFALGLAVHDDALYVSRSEFRNAGNTIEIYAPLAHPRLVGQITGLHNPMGITFDSDGELYICNAGDGDVLALPAHQRGPVHPDRTITNPNHSLCTPNPNPFVFFAGGLALLGPHLFVGANGSTDVVELDARRGGVQIH